MSIDIANESGVAVGEVELAALARHVLDRLRIHPLAELSVLLVDEDAMADLHQRWMGEPGPTDVLAFPMDELRPPRAGGGHAMSGGQEPKPIPGLLGDVVLCPQIAVKQAAAQGHGTADEVDLLCVHGILHLLGYEHGDPDQHAEMFRLQQELLDSWRAAGRGGTKPVVASAGPPGEPAQAGSPEGNGAREPGGPARDDVHGGREGPG